MTPILCCSAFSWPFPFIYRHGHIRVGLVGGSSTTPRRRTEARNLSVPCRAREKSIRLGEFQPKNGAREHKNRVILTYFWITVRDPSESRRNQVARLRALSGNTHASDWWKRPYSCSFCYKFRNARLQRARPALGLRGPSRKFVGFLSRSVDDKSAIWRSEWHWWNQFCCC